MSGRSLILLFSLCLLVGCVQVDQVFTIKADGSGTLDFTYGMPEEHVAQMEQFAQMAAAMDPDAQEVLDTGGGLSFDEEEIRKSFEAYAVEGVTLAALSSEQRDGFRYVRMQIDFGSLAALGRTEFMSEQDVMLIRDANGNYLFQQSAPSGGHGSQEIMGMADGQMDPFLGEMMKGFKITTTIKTPSRILETNAEEFSGDTATWVFDFEKDPAAIQKVREAAMRVVFEGNEMSISEFRSRGN